MRSRNNGTRNKARHQFIFWLSVVVVICLVALIGPYFLPHDPLEANLQIINQPPSAEYPLGTDSLGRCIACRIVAGAQTTIFSAFVIVALCFAIGTVVGTLSGYIGGRFDAVVMRVVDAFMAFPSLVFSIAVAGMLGVGLRNAIIALTVVGWTKFARLARSQVLSVKERTFVKAETVGGLSRSRIAIVHVLPNTLRPLIVTACLDVGNMMLGLAGLSYLGLGAAPPAPEWGSMLNQGADMFQLAPWAVFAPGIAILVVVMALNMFGDSANELLDPQDSGGQGGRGCRGQKKGTWRPTLVRTFKRDGDNARPEAAMSVIAKLRKSRADSRDNKELRSEL